MIIWVGVIVLLGVCGVALLIAWLNNSKDKTALFFLTFIWVAAVGAVAYFFISLIQFMSHI